LSAQRRTLARSICRLCRLDFRGGEGVGGWTARAEQLAQQVADFAGPRPVVVAAGMARHPGALAASGTSAQVASIEDVKSAATHTEFADGIGG